MNHPDNDSGGTADTSKDNSAVHSDTKSELDNDEASLGYIDRLRTAHLGNGNAEATESDASEVDDKAAHGNAADEDLIETQADANLNSMMPHEARRALVSLMRHGTVLAHSKKHIFDIVCQHQQAIRRHLSEVYLQLVLDERAGVAFIAGIDAEHDAKLSSTTDEDVVDLTEDDDIEPATLITRRTLSLYDTLLLLVLRKHFQEREVSCEQKIMIGIERIESLMTPFLPLTNSERADRSKLRATIKRMIDKRLLAKIRGSEDRYEITPIIRYVVKAEFLESMLQEYYRLADELGLTLDRGDDGAMTVGAANNVIKDEER